MSVQQKRTSVIEELEGRQLFSGGTGKVSMNDFHFVMKTANTEMVEDIALATSSHGTGAGGGKVSMNDFHFVMWDAKTEMVGNIMTATGGGAGKVSMDD